MVGTQGIQQIRKSFEGSPINYNVGIIEETKFKKTWKGHFLQLDVLSKKIDNISIS